MVGGRSAGYGFKVSDRGVASPLQLQRRQVSRESTVAVAKQYFLADWDGVQTQ